MRVKITVIGTWLVLVRWKNILGLCAYTGQKFEFKCDLGGNGFKIL